MSAFKGRPGVAATTNAGNTNNKSILPRSSGQGNRQLMLRDRDESLLLSLQIVQPKIIAEVRSFGILPADLGGFGHSAIQASLYQMEDEGQPITMARLLEDLTAAIGIECEPREMLGEMLCEIYEFAPIHNWPFYASRVAGAALARAIYFEAQATKDAILNCRSISDIEAGRQDREAARLEIFERLGAAV